MQSNNPGPVLEKNITRPPEERSRRNQRSLLLLTAFGAGIVASLVSVVCMLLLRLAAGIPTPVELFGDFALKHMPVERFVALLIFFGPNAKTAPLGLTLLSMVILGGVLGLLYAVSTRVNVPVVSYQPARREWLTMLLLGLVLCALGGILFWTEIRQNFLGLPLLWARLATLLGLLLDFEIYALALGWCYRALLPKQARAEENVAAKSRRALLTRGSVAVLGLGATAGSLGLARTFLSNYSAYDGMQTFTHNGVTSPITPNSEHYVVTQNPVDPTPALNVWRLELSGLIGTPGNYTYEEFIKLPSVTRAVTLECIANYIGGHLMSTAIWQGVTLQALLEKHGGAQPGARYVVFYSADGYTVSQPLDEALAADALLAFRMNGSELPIRHGYPLRVLFPGRYGEENPKWVTRIELSDRFVGGLYADQGWYNGPLHTITRIDRPRDRIPFLSHIEIGGVAFAGNRSIARVEISTDNGATWHDAQLAPPLSQDAWVLWTYQWHPATRGHYTLVARATDGTGQVQTSQRQGTVPNGATGYHIVPVMLA